MALVAAVALHAALFGFARRAFVPAAVVARQVEHAVELEVGAWPVVERSPSKPPEERGRVEALGVSSGSRRLARSMASRQVAAVAPSEVPGPEGAVEVENQADPVVPPAESVAPAPRIDIWRTNAADRVALLEALDTPAPSEAQPSIGLLREGLAELDTLTGLSRSSAAVPAAYEAAQLFAPATGIAVFELRTDASGAVQSVRLVSPLGESESWGRVGQALKEGLAKRSLRAPPGTKGMVTRVRVERGELAVALSERHRTKRGAALGQGPTHPKEESDESTRASLEPGRLSPTLGIEVSGARARRPTRVVILSEQYL